MIPIATSLIVPAFIPNNLVATKSNFISPVSFDKNKVEIPETQKKTVSKQQIIAGMAFHLFFAEALPIFSFDDRFVKIKKYALPFLLGSNNDSSLAPIFQVKDKFLAFLRNNETIKTGKSTRNNICEYTSELKDHDKTEDVVSFSKELDDKKVIVIYNTSSSEAKEKFIMMHNDACLGDTRLDIVYGYNSCGNIMLYHSILNNKPISYIKIHLDPLQLVILKN